MGGNKTGWSAGLAVALDDAWFFDHGLAVGLVMDADTDPEAGFDRCRHALTSNRLPEPEGPEQIAFDGRRRSGIFVTPGGGKPGAIEELLLEAAETARVQEAAAYLEQLERDGFGAFEQRSKSLLQAYLAGQPRLVKTIPVGVRRDEVFPARSYAFESFRRFLRGLAGEDVAEGGALRLN